MAFSEVFAIIGYPSRAAGRLPLLLRYVWGAKSNVFAPSRYASERWGSSYWLRPWLLIDAKELEDIEHLINNGTDEDAFDFRSVQLMNSSSTAVVGSLLASACAITLTLEVLKQIDLTVRGCFTVSLVLSVLAVYLTVVQQRELSAHTTAPALRVWLWNANLRRYPSFQNPEAPTDESIREIKESSLACYYILYAPLELLRIAITSFLAGTVAYLTLAWRSHLRLGTGPSWRDQALLIAFVFCTAFPLLMYGQSLGQKDREMMKCRSVEQRPLPIQKRVHSTRKIPEATGPT